MYIMNRPKQLVLLRHAESARNVAKPSVYFADEYARKHIKGIPDYEIPITDEGEIHARKTGEFLRKKFGVFDYIYHSGYKRTKDTMLAALSAYPKDEVQKMSIRHDLFIRERDPGYAYDMTQAEAEAAFPWLKEYWNTYGGFFAHPVGGESIAKMCERVYQFLGMLYADHQNEKILVVTHGGTIRAFRFLLEHWNYEQAIQWPEGSAPKNCSMTVYNYDEKSKHLLLSDYNLEV